MQNKWLSLTFLIGVSMAVAFPVKAQDGGAAPQAPVVVDAKNSDKTMKSETAQERIEQAKQRREELEKMRAERMAAAKERADKKAAAPSSKETKQPTDKSKPAEQKTESTLPNLERITPAPIANVLPGANQQQVQEENKKRLEEELGSAAVSGKGVVDFPNRPSLGSLELTPLPGINESAVGGPLPMGKSVSGKDLPSEQLLGRITPEVFQEMADLERGNTFLKLQKEKEQLKNELENLKATYRQKRLDEIEKRENVVRTRIQWWQEQEKLRLAIEKKQEEEAELARKVAMKEAERNQVQEEAKRQLRKQNRQSSAASKAATSGNDIPEEQDEEKTEVLPQAMENLYAIESIRGIGSDLSAKIRSKQDGAVLVVKQDDILPTGHVVQEVKKDVLIVAYGNRVDQLVFRPNQK